LADDGDAFSHDKIQMSLPKDVRTWGQPCRSSA